MVVFFFYLAAICVLFAICAAIAELIGWLYPDWLSPDDPLAEADRSLEDAPPTEGTVI